MNTKKIKEFVKSHKKKIVLTTGIGVSAIVISTVLAKQKRKEIAVFPEAKDLGDIPIPKDFAVGEITDLWNEGGFVNAILKNINSHELGKLGEELVSKGIIRDDADISLVIGARKN